MLFHDLDEDVLAQILVSSDIYSVLSFLRVSKSFRHLALSKQLWLSLVHDLSTRYFIPKLDTVHECTSAQLIAKVRWFVCGPATWSQQSSVLPTVSFSKTFSFPVTIPWRRRSRILPGGRYFAVWEDSDLQCFEVVTGRRVWSRPLTGNNSVSWDVEILDDGASAIFIFVQFYSLTETEILSIVRVDFRTGHSEESFHMGLNRDIAHYHSPVLSGHLLAIGVRRHSPRQRVILLIDWRRQAYAIVDCTRNLPKTHLAFVPGHIILASTTLEPPRYQLIFIYTLRSMASFWRPVAECLHNLDAPGGGLDDLHIHPGNVRPAAVERLEHNNRIFQLSPSRGGSGYSCLQVHMTLYPIRHNAYKLMVYASDPGSSRGETFRQAFSGRTGRASGAMLFTYRITLDDSPEHCLSWTRTSVVTTVSELTLPLSYAGYTLNRGSDGAMRIIDPRPTPRFLLKWAGPRIRECVVISREGNEQSLSSTGGIFISRLYQIEISYYA